MPLEHSDLPEPTEDLEGGEEGELAPKPRIAEWVTELPRPRRTTDFDPVIEEIRTQGAPGQWARLENGGSKAITANKISTLKKRYTDVEFKQVGGQTFAALKKS
jgi:hypothetical protein